MSQSTNHVTTTNHVNSKYRILSLHRRKILLSYVITLFPWNQIELVWALMAVPVLDLGIIHCDILGCSHSVDKSWLLGVKLKCIILYWISPLWVLTMYEQEILACPILSQVRTDHTLDKPGKEGEGKYNEYFSFFWIPCHACWIPSYKNKSLAWTFPILIEICMNLFFH